MPRVTFSKPIESIDEAARIREALVGLEVDRTVLNFDAKQMLGASPTIKLVAFDDIRLGKERRYLVKHLLPRVGLSVIWGPPKSGKSFWTFDLAMHVALGWEYRGRRVHQGPVIYGAFEGQTGIEARCEAFRQRFLPEDTDPIPFYLEPVTLDLVRDHAALNAAIEAKLGPDTPVLVVLDTLNKSLRGSESSDEDMSAYVRAADVVREKFNCAVVVVHHCGIDGTRPRGHTALTGACDAQLAVKRDAGDNIVVTVEAMKDGPNGDTIVSKLEPTDVGIDNDGDTITSCVVLPVDGVKAVPPNRKLSDRQKLALAALDETLLATGKSAPANFQLPSGTRVVTLADWREELYRRGVLDRETKNPRQDFKRIRESLAARLLIGEREERIWKG